MQRPPPAAAVAAVSAGRVSSAARALDLTVHTLPSLSLTQSVNLHSSSNTLQSHCHLRPSQLIHSFTAACPPSALPGGGRQAVPVALPGDGCLALPGDGCRSVPLALPGDGCLALPGDGCQSVPVALPGDGRLALPGDGRQAVLVALPGDGCLALPGDGRQAVDDVSVCFSDNSQFPRTVQLPQRHVELVNWCWTQTDRGQFHTHTHISTQRLLCETGA